MAASSCHFLCLHFPNAPASRPAVAPSLPSPAPSRLCFPGRTSPGEARPRLPPPHLLFSSRGTGLLVLNSGYNAQVVVGEDEPEEVLLRRFRREVTKAGVIQECKRRRFFENSQEERKRKAREAGRRNRRRRSGPRSNSFSSFKASTSPKGEPEDAEDNWEMPEDDVLIRSFTA